MTTTTARAELLPSQVLVVFNSASADAVTVKNAYLAAHPGIPTVNVVDINDPAMLVSDLNYNDFVSGVRGPIRNHLNAGGGNPGPADIVSIVLIRPIPHRLLDEFSGAIGDMPTAAGTRFSSGNATFGSIDAELVMLWQNNRAGEANGVMDSRLDNVIANPYHKRTVPVSGFSRANITNQKSYTNAANVAWVHDGISGAQRLTEGDLYLVSRIDANSVNDALVMIERARDLVVNKAFVRVLFDEWNVSIATTQLDDQRLFAGNDPFYAGNDYQETRDQLQAAGWDVRYDGTQNFVDGPEETTPLIGYASYGVNHGNTPAWGDLPNPVNYIGGFNFARGAVFNTIESFNGRKLNGLGSSFGQEQASNFIAAGGTFAIGHVWEPTAIFVPDNEFLMGNLFREGDANLSWGEAAYSSIPALSWQHVVLGDPLARPIIVNDPTPLLGDLNGDGLVDGDDIQPMVTLATSGIAAYHVLHPTLDPYRRGDFNGDFRITSSDISAFTALLLN